MKKFNILILCTMLLMLLATCKKNEGELGTLPDKSTIKYSVVQDKVKDPGGNTVILTNSTPGTVAIWDYETGRSNRAVDTVHYAFKGTYVVKFSALTAAGIVECDSVKIVVTDDNLMYVNDPLWTKLSGGVGHEKTWLLDLDANGQSKFFNGPVYFAGESNANTRVDGTDLKWTKECSILNGPDAVCFAWEADWVGNQWITDKGDYGSMTFSLKGGPFVTVNHKMIPALGQQSGTYFLDINTKILNMTGAEVLQNTWGSSNVANWISGGKIITLTDNAMQIAYHDKAKPEVLIFNYISKEYSDNWVAPVKGDPNFNFGNQTQLLTTSNSKSWGFDLQTPYNWFGLDGTSLNPTWTSRAAYAATGWAPYGDSDTANIMNARITFSADKSVTVKMNDGTTQKGTFTIDETKNIITFKDVTPNIPIASWVSATTTADNQWKIVKVDKAALTDEVIGIWFGKRDPVKSEYMVFHFLKK